MSLKEKNESSKNSRLLSMNNVDDKNKKSFKLEKFDIEILSSESFDLQNNKMNNEDNLNLIINSKSLLSKKETKIRRIFSFNDNGIPAKLHLYSYKLNLVDYYDYVYRNYSKYFWYKRCMELQSELKNSNSRARENYLTNNLILAQKNYHSFNSKNSNVTDFSNNNSFTNIDSKNQMKYPLNNNSFQSSGNVIEKLKLYDSKNSSSNFQLFTSNKTTNNNSLLIDSSKTKTTILDLDSLNDKSKIQNTIDINSKIKSNSNIDVVNNTMDYFNERNKSSFIQHQVQSKSFNFKNRNLNLGHDYSNKFSKNK